MKLSREEVKLNRTMNDSTSITKVVFDSLKRGDSIYANYDNTRFRFVKSNKVFTTMLTEENTIHKTSNRDLCWFFRTTK